MKNKKIPYWDTFVEEENGFFKIQVQAPCVTIDLKAKKLGFTDKVLEYLEETRENPKYRNTKDDSGTWYYNEKNFELKLNKYFKSSKVTLAHFAEYNSSYYLRIKDKNLRVIMCLQEQQIDSFIQVINEIKEHQKLD